MRVYTRFRARSSCLLTTLVYICSNFCAKTSLAQSNDWPLTRNDHLRRVSFLNDDGDVYVESSGTGSEIVLKTGKVRVSDGDVYCGISSTEGLAAGVDALTTQDDAFDSRMNTLNDTHADLQGNLNTLDATLSGRFISAEATLASLAFTDTSLSAMDASLSSRIDVVNTTDAQLKATDETFKTRISSLNATDAAMKGVDDGLSSRIDALRDIYVNELNVTDEQLTVTDAKLGSRIDALNATQFELKGVDTGLSSRLDALEPSHEEYERIDDKVASLIDSLNATDATMQAKDVSLSNRIDALNSTSQALSSIDASLSAQIASLKPPKCTEPGGDELLFNGTHWECVCVSASYGGKTCEMRAFAEFTKLFAGDGRYDDRFGGWENHAAAISGDTIVIGAPHVDDEAHDSGSIYVFVLDSESSKWEQQAKIINPGGTSYDNLGFSVAIDGDTLVAGAVWEDYQGFDVGGAFIYIRSGSTWTKQAALQSSDSANYRFGVDVAIEGDTVIVGARGVTSDDPTASRHSPGCAFVFVRSGTTWTQQAKLTASDAATFDEFGTSVTLYDGTVVIGAHKEDEGGDGSGSAYVFVRSGTTWTQQAKLTVDDAEPGDRFGSSVSLYDDTVVIGAHEEDEGGDGSGSAYVFVRSGTTWTQQAKLTVDDAEPGDRFGSSVSLYDDTVIIGAHEEDEGGDGSGSAYVFVRSGTTWTQQAKLTASDASTNHYFGRAVAFDGTRAVVAADKADSKGAAYVFDRLTIDETLTFDFRDGPSLWECYAAAGGQCYFDYDRGVWVLSHGGVLRSRFFASRLNASNVLAFSVSFKTSSDTENLRLYLYGDEDTTPGSGDEISGGYCGCGYSGGQSPNIASQLPRSCASDVTNVNSQWSTASFYTARLENIFAFDTNREMIFNVTHDGKNLRTEASISNGVESFSTRLGYSSISDECFKTGRLIITNRDCVPGCPQAEISSITVNGDISF